jgi:hypothetical protein
MATFMLRQKFKGGFQKYKPMLDVLPKKYEVGGLGWVRPCSLLARAWGAAAAGAPAPVAAATRPTRRPCAAAPADRAGLTPALAAG